MPGPPPGVSPRRTVVRSIVLLALVLGGLVAVRWSVTGGLTRPLAPPGAGPPTGSSRASGLSAREVAALRGNLLYLGGRQVLVVDPAAGSIAPLTSPGTGRVRVLRQDGFIVLLSRDGHAAVQPVGGVAGQSALGAADDVLPAPVAGRVWLVSHGDDPDRAFVLREMDLASRRALRRWTLPYDAEPLAVVPAGMLVRDLQSQLEVRDPSGRRVASLGRDLTFVDRHGDLLAYIDDRGLHLRDLGGGLDRTVAPPAGAKSWFALGPPLPGLGCCSQLGAFSPDGRTLALFTQLAGPGQPGLTIVDVATGRASLLRGSGGATPVACQPCLGWSRAGWLFFFNAGPALADPAAWRPGQAAAIPLSLELAAITTVLPTSLAPA